MFIPGKIYEYFALKKPVLSIGYKEGSLKVVIFAGGCFWCAANNFYSLKGVKEVYSGYASGDVFFPTYEEVKTGLTGHRESIFIYYNEEEVKRIVGICNKL